MEIEVQRRLLGQMAISRETSEQVHAKVDGAAVTRVLDLADVLDLVDDGLNERAFAQEQLIGETQESVAHVLAQRQFWIRERAESQIIPGLDQEVDCRNVLVRC